MKTNGNRKFRRSLLKSLPLVTLGLMGLTACQDDFGGYYDTPDWVQSSSADVLKGRSDCKIYMQLVNKTLFSKQVEGSGQYTFFVPTDAAFNEFFANNPYGYKSVDDIPEDVAARMVSSWMMYNAYPCDTLANVMNGFNKWETNTAFKHQTPSYDVLREETVDGVKCQVYDALSKTFAMNNNAPSWHNYRFLPVFTGRFNNNNSISSADWQKVVGSDFSQFGNYLQAGIVDAGNGYGGDLYCQNGVIHLVNKVVMPLDNLDAMIRTYGDGTAIDQPADSKQGAWSLLRSVLYHKLGSGQYQFLSYDENTTATHYFEKAYPEVDMSNLRLRQYNRDANPFRLNVESYVDMQTATTLASELFFTDYNGGMTFYVPEKSVLLNYINDKLFQYTGDKLTESSTQAEFDAAFNKLPENVLTTLWRSMQANGMIWPSQFEGTAVNSVGGAEHINGYEDGLTYDTGVLASGMASNAMWQITNFVPKTAAFEGVASRFLLDPEYGNESDVFSGVYSNTIYKNMLASKLAGMDDVNVSLILWGQKNATWWDNIHYSTLLSAYATGEAGSETSVQSSYFQNMLNGYIEREAIDALDFEVDPLNGAYGGWAYTNNYAGEVMRYRKTGKTVNGQPEIQIQTSWLLANDENEKQMQVALSTDHTSMPTSLQTTDPSEGSFATIVKDNSNSYINGNVYLATENSAPLAYEKSASESYTFGNGLTYKPQDMGVWSYLRAYLVADSIALANGEIEEAQSHQLFKAYIDYYYENQKSATASLAIGSGYWTIFVPTNEALQWAYDYPTTHDGLRILRSAASMPKNPTPEGESVANVNWVDSCIYIINAYVTKSGCYPDDGLSAFYEMSECWDGIASANRQAPTQYLVSTNDVITDMDNSISGVIYKPWDGLISGGRMSGYVAKAGDQNKLQYFGRPYTSGAFQVVDVYNASDISNGAFDNTVVRQQGQSNIMCNRGMIHSLNGFVIYKIASK